MQDTKYLKGQKGLIVLDLDFTLYNTELLMQACAKVLLKYGLNTEDYFDTYPLARVEGQVYYDLKTHAQLVARRTANPSEAEPAILADWQRIIETVSPQAFDLDELRTFVDSLDSDYESVILTLGERDFQTRKINAGGVLTVIPGSNIHIVDSRQEKVEKVRVWLQRYPHVVFINDSISQNSELNEIFSNEIETDHLTILEMRRSYKDKSKQRQDESDGIIFIKDLGEKAIHLCQVDSQN